MKTVIRGLLLGAAIMAAGPAIAQSKAEAAGAQAVAPSGGTTVQKGVSTQPAPKSCPDRQSPLPDGTCPGLSHPMSSQGGSNVDTTSTPASSMK